MSGCAALLRQMRNDHGALSILGLAMRAGQVVSGDDLCESEIRRGKVALVLIDEGVSANTRGKYSALCGARAIPLHEIRADALGCAIGKPNRMIVAVRKGPLATKMSTLLP